MAPDIVLVSALLLGRDSDFFLVTLIWASASLSASKELLVGIVECSSRSTWETTFTECTFEADALTLLAALRLAFRDLDLLVAGPITDPGTNFRSKSSSLIFWCWCFVGSTSFEKESRLKTDTLSVDVVGALLPAIFGFLTARGCPL
jgi:hypothetical protein